MNNKVEHFTCRFCNSKFVQEQRYLKHRCEQMIRDEEFRTPIGQAAWSYYQKWMKAYRRSVAGPATFLGSRYYRSFIRFAKNSLNVKLPDVDSFIMLMKEKDISPTIWTNDQVYALYLEFLDRRATPLQQAKITINTLFDLADEKQCEVEELFDNLLVNDIIELVRARKLSPWILLFSSKFGNMLRNRTTPEQRIILESIIRPAHWKTRFTKYPKDVALMKKYVEELNI